MKFELFNSETNKLWKSMSSKTASGDLQVELELYKKLLNFFQVGDYFYFIFNMQNVEFDLLSPEVETMLGYHPSELTVPFFMDCIHPEDRPWFLTFEAWSVNFLSNLPIEKLMKYKARYDFRLRKKNGEYIRVLHQVAIIQHDENGGVLRTLGVHTDITHLKPEGKPMISYIGMDGEPSYLNIDVQKTLMKSNDVLSKREKQVLSLLIDGKVSKEIGSILNISIRTVETHRKNMLRKNNLNSTGELIGKAIRNGWI
jgi:DNA-binding CsgD family transcriptional regulator